MIRINIINSILTTWPLASVNEFGVAKYLAVKKGNCFVIHCQLDSSGTIHNGHLL
jgi:hypothetical protein